MAKLGARRPQAGQGRNTLAIQSMHQSRYGQLDILDCLATLVGGRQPEAAGPRLQQAREALLALHGSTIGHAFGNRIARMAAADRPDLVRLVVLLGCSGKVQPSPEIAEAIRVAQAPDTDPATRARAVQEAWFAPGRDISTWLDGWSQPVMASYLAAAAATDTASWWTAGQADVVIIQGLADVSAPPENGRLLKSEIGGRATLVELPGIGHALPVEDPGTVADTIIAQLAMHGA